MINQLQVNTPSAFRDLPGGDGHDGMISPSQGLRASGKGLNGSISSPLEGPSLSLALNSVNEAAFHRQTMSLYRDFSPRVDVAPSNAAGVLARAQQADAEIKGMVGGGVFSIGRTLLGIIFESNALMRKDELGTRLLSRSHAKQQHAEQASLLRDAAKSGKGATDKSSGLSIAIAAFAICLAFIAPIGYGVKRCSSYIGSKVPDSVKSGFSNVWSKRPWAKPSANIEADAVLPNPSAAKTTDGATDPSLKTRQSDSGIEGAPDADPNAVQKQAKVKDADPDGAKAKEKGKGTPEDGDEKKKELAQRINALVMTLGGVGAPAGQLAGAKDTLQSKREEADAGIRAAQAEETKGQGDVSREVEQSLEESLKRLVEAAKDLQAAEHSQLQAVTRG